MREAILKERQMLAFRKCTEGLSDEEEKRFEFLNGELDRFDQEDEDEFLKLKEYKKELPVLNPAVLQRLRDFINKGVK